MLSNNHPSYPTSYSIYTWYVVYNILYVFSYVSLQNICLFFPEGVVNLGGVLFLVCLLLTVFFERWRPCPNISQVTTLWSQVSVLLT